MQENRSNEHSNLDKILGGIKSDIDSLDNMGFVESKRKKDTGIGKTFEDLVGIYENNNCLADYQGIVEYKTFRNKSESSLTLATKSPKPRGINTYIREKYGKPDSEYENIKVVHSTFYSDKFYNSNDVCGYKIEVNDPDKKMYIKIKDISSEDIDPKLPYCDYNDINKLVHNKLKYIALIEAETKTEEGKEYFHFYKGQLLSGLTSETFIDAIKDTKIAYEFRIGAYKSGPKIGKTHDHGTGFRIKRKKIKEVFDVSDI